MFNTIISRIRDKALTKSLTGRILSKALSIPTLGRIAFKLSIFIKKLSLLKGSWSQRAVEYPWVLTQIKKIKHESLILDVGCAESLLSHELTAKVFKVVGLDIRDYTFKSRKISFIKRNVMDTQLPVGTFDAIIVVSTIEHIGLNAYGQLTLDDGGDIKAMEELHKILKPQGIVIITTPYIGNNPLKVYSSERNYNRQRLEKLVEGFQIISEEYFYPERMGRRLQWTKMNREKIDQKSFTEPGLACLVLKKL